MKDSSDSPGRVPAQGRDTGIQYLAASALRVVKERQCGASPTSRADWIDRFCDALMSKSEISHQGVFGAMIANGIPSSDIYDSYIPDAARLLGERWVRDEATFVEVTVGAGRLQQLLRGRCTGSGRLDRSIPLGQSILMVVPEFEDHSLGAFLAADGFRRHGLWVHMGIGFSAAELADAVSTGRFAMVGISGGCRKSVESLSDLVENLRGRIETPPPIVIGGRVVDLVDDVGERTGADHAVTTPREAIERCGLATVAEPLTF